MSAKTTSKAPKLRKIKQIKEQEQPKAPMTPQKRQNEHGKTPFLRDLSPFSPIYRTVKRSYDIHAAHCDLAMIETPLNAHRPKSIIQEVEAHCNQISRLLVWQQEQQDQVNSGSAEVSSSNQIKSNSDGAQQNLKQNMSAGKGQNMRPISESQMQQKAGQKIKNTKIYKKVQQKKPKIQESQNKRKLTCNCKKTKCLKLYCDCFHDNQVCGPLCNCVGCHNTDQYKEQRYNSMLSLMQRNPQAFHPKLQAEQHAKGCHCKKSGCLKKYCECYQAGLTCGQHCKCQQCKNCKTENKSKSIQFELHNEICEPPKMDP